MLIHKQFENLLESLVFVRALNRFFKSFLHKCLLIVSLIFILGCSATDEGALYHIGIDPSWYPQDFRGKEPALTGFSEGLIRAIGEEEGFNVQILSAGSEFLEWGLSEGRFDGILTSLSPAVNYEGRYLFSKPYLLIGPVLVVTANSPLKKRADLKGKTVAALRGSQVVSVLGETVPGIVITAYDQPGPVFENLLNGSYDAVAMPVLMAKSYVNDLYQGRLKIIDDPLTEEALRLVALVGDEDLIDGFNSGLHSLQKNDHYEELAEEWHVN